MSVTVLPNQSLLDIAIQDSGSLEAIFDLATCGNLSITEKLPIGLELNKNNIVNQDIVNYYSFERLRPATEEDLFFEEGIEFWAIEIDFIVS